MPKKAYFATHLDSARLKQHYQSCPDTVESRRWHLLWLISTDWSIKRAALAIGISYDYAKAIVADHCLTSTHFETALRLERGFPLLLR